MFKLTRHSDGAGDSGSMSEAIGPEGTVRGHAPQVGCFMRVGSRIARTYQHQDWWQTTPITEILKDEITSRGVRCVIFKTRNSMYTWAQL